jgi:hypothetical protein
MARYPVIRLRLAVVCHRRYTTQIIPIPSIGSQYTNGTRRSLISRYEAYINVTRTAAAEITKG